MNEALKQTMLAYLKEHNTVTVATLEASTPWATALFYANDAFTLYFLSDPKTRHCQNLAGNTRVAATINEDYHDWRSIKGIQLEGTASLVTGRIEKARAMAIYLRKYPFVGDFFASPAKIGKGMFGKVSSTSLYKIVPARIFFVDNEKGFGHREELSLEGSER